MSNSPIELWEVNIMQLKHLEQCLAKIKSLINIRHCSHNCCSVTQSCLTLCEKIKSLINIRHCSYSCCCSVTQSCLTLCDPVDCNTPGFSVLHYLPELAQMYVCWVGDAIQPSHPLLLLPSIFLSIWVFSNELAGCLRWPKYWSFSISPFNEYSGFISFRIDWFDLLAVL